MLAVRGAAEPPRVTTLTSAGRDTTPPADASPAGGPQLRDRLDPTDPGRHAGGPAGALTERRRLAAPDETVRDHLTPLIRLADETEALPQQQAAELCC